MTQNVNIYRRSAYCIQKPIINIEFVREALADKRHYFLSYYCERLERQEKGERIAYRQAYKRWENRDAVECPICQKTIEKKDNGLLKHVEMCFFENLLRVGCNCIDSFQLGPSAW